MYMIIIGHVLKIISILTSEVKVGKIDVKLSRAWSFLSSQNLLLFNSRGVAKMNTIKSYMFVVVSHLQITNERKILCEIHRIFT